MSARFLCSASNSAGQLSGLTPAYFRVSFTVLPEIAACKSTIWLSMGGSSACSFVICAWKLLLGFALAGVCAFAARDVLVTFAVVTPPCKLPKSSFVQTFGAEVEVVEAAGVVCVVALDVASCALAAAAAKSKQP